jgi:hypothetical protein
VRGLSTNLRHSSPIAGSGLFSCVVDVEAVFSTQALRWFAVLTRITDVPPDQLVVHSVDGHRSPELTYLARKGVTVLDVPRFDPRSPHCNKISGMARLGELAPGGINVLTDTDVIIFEDVRRYPLPPGTVGSKPVDTSNPPLPVLENLFAVAGIAPTPVVALEAFPNQGTFAGNGNGGLYLVPGPLLAPLADAWGRWARWLLDRPELLGASVYNTDQVAMCMALADGGVSVQCLDGRWNQPAHYPDLIPDPPPMPAVIHYHRRVDERGKLELTGREIVDQLIKAANDAYTDVLAEVLP